MGMNDTPSADRVHIGFFGKRNAGKSSVLNAVTGQDLAVVSDVCGTTTDPVVKAMELLPLGPVVMIDTPGIDDEGELGALRVKKSYQTLNKTDVAVLVVDAAAGPGPEDLELFGRIRQKQIPVVVAYNKADSLKSAAKQPGCSVPEPTAEPAGQKAPASGLSATQPWDGLQPLYISARTGQGIAELKERLAALGKPQENSRRIVADLLEPMDLAVLVVPIDSAAPKGRLILPQQQTIRDVLEASAVAVVVKDTELKETLSGLGKKPKLVITDSQAFARVSRETPEDVLLTSFSILFARYKGNLAAVAAGARAVEQVGDGDKVLICEGCTHHRQCEDIGTVKIPKWLSEYTGKNLVLEHSSGRDFPEDLSPYKLVIHCGGCMLNQREITYRQKTAGDSGVPFTNYGITIAHLKGILKRSVELFPDLYALLP